MLADEPFSTMCLMATLGPARLGAPGDGGHRHSVLMLRQMYLTALAYQGLGGRTTPQMGSSFLEHTMDPTERRQVFINMGHEGLHRVHHSLIKFDECRLGQVVVKATALSTDLPLHHWHELRCNHKERPRREKLNSSDLSRYPEEMMQGLAVAIVCRAGPDFFQGHGTPPHTILASMDTAMQGASLSDPVMFLQMAFKQRPLRDVASLPWADWLRGRGLCHKQLRWARRSASWGERLQESLSVGEGSHPFLEDLLHSIRDPCPEKGGPAEGQTFHLDVLHSLAADIQDPDFQFPLELCRGVPLKVSRVS